MFCLWSNFLAKILEIVIKCHRFCIHCMLFIRERCQEDIGNLIASSSSNSTRKRTWLVYLCTLGKWMSAILGKPEFFILKTIPSKSANLKLSENTTLRGFARNVRSLSGANELWSFGIHWRHLIRAKLDSVVHLLRLCCPLAVLINGHFNILEQALRGRDPRHTSRLNFCGMSHMSFLTVSCKVNAFYND